MCRWWCCADPSVCDVCTRGGADHGDVGVTCVQVVVLTMVACV